MNPDLYCASVTYKSNTYDKPIFNLVKFLAWTEIGYFAHLALTRRTRLHKSVNPYEVRQLLGN